MRLVLVCSRPAVSASTTSAPFAAADAIPSKMTDDGSPPSAPRTRSAPQRSAQVPSCSAAAARKVSPAAITTVWPCSVSRLPTLPIVVVLPTPFTPTNSQTDGGASAVCSSTGPARRCFISAFTASISSTEVVMPRSLTVARTASSSSVAGPMPTSARISASSSSSQVSASISVRDRIDPT